ATGVRALSHHELTRNSPHRRTDTGYHGRPASACSQVEQRGSRPAAAKVAPSLLLPASTNDRLPTRSTQVRRSRSSASTTRADNQRRQTLATGIVDAVLFGYAR